MSSFVIVWPFSQHLKWWYHDSWLTTRTWTGEIIKSSIKAMFVERKSNKSAVLPGAPCQSPIIANFSRKIAQLGNFANYEQILCLLKSFLKKQCITPLEMKNSSFLPTLRDKFPSSSALFVLQRRKWKFFHCDDIWQISISTIFCPEWQSDQNIQLWHLGSLW